MQAQRVFLNAAWRKLVMLNYAVSPEILQPWVPAHTELDLWNGVCYVSVVGFMFENMRALGVPVPFNSNFEEINLRFYVKRNDPELGWKRGVTFIREIIPSVAVGCVANLMYREHYKSYKMWHRWADDQELLEVEYGWRQAGRWHGFGVRAEQTPVEMKPGSEAEFITEHFWGYSVWDKKRTMEYQVEHPRWRVHPIKAWHCELDFGEVYPPAFAPLTTMEPVSVFLAEGSDIMIRKGKLISS